MPDLKKIKDLIDKAYVNSQVPREQAADDLVFANINQWDDGLLSDSQLSYRGQFDIIRKAVRQICADMEASPVQVDFEPVDEQRSDSAELLDGLYRSDDRRNESIEAYQNATQEQVTCGVGAWELYTEYESDAVGNMNQVIRREPIFEANNVVFWDPNARLADKSDAKYCVILKAYSEDGYKDMVEELTGERPDSIPGNIKQPEQSYTFPWYSQKKVVYVGCFYWRDKAKEELVTFNDPFGGSLTVTRDNIDLIEDELMDAGYDIAETKEVERYRVTKYIVTGEEILDKAKIAGRFIPVVPCYGERSIVEGVEYWEGIVRRAADPQRLRNFHLSYMADIVSRSPRQKPIFTPEQIAGFEDMYNVTGADNNYPYLLQNSTDANGQPLPVGPMAVMPDQPIPNALVQMEGLIREAVNDVANPGLPQDIADPDLSGKAVFAIQSRLDMQTMIYQTNLKHAKRRDGLIYASMASEIYDTPRKVTLTNPDGTREKVTIMETVIDRETGEIVTMNDLSNTEFDVYTEIGTNYSTSKQQTLEQMAVMYQSMPDGDPMKQALLYQQLLLVDGIGLDGIRKQARKQLILMGYEEPVDEEEAQMLAQAQQAQQSQQDPMVVAAQAEMLKGQADMQQAQSKQMDSQVNLFKAQTDRMNVEIKAAEAGVKIQKTEAETQGIQLDNQIKPIKATQEILRGSMTQ